MELKDVYFSWKVLSSYLIKPSNNDELDRLIEFSDKLMDIIGEDEEHELFGLLDMVGDIIHKYEIENIPEPAATPVESLKYLMEEHGLKQKDLVEIGSPGVVSEVLNGKRTLNVRQIKSLSEKFGVRSDLFI